MIDDWVQVSYERLRDLRLYPALIMIQHCLRRGIQM